MLTSLTPDNQADLGRGGGTERRRLNGSADVQKLAGKKRTPAARSRIANGRFRRILPIPARSGGGRLSERTPAVQPSRRERLKVPPSGHSRSGRRTARLGRVGMWRGGGRLGISVSAPFVWRCLSGSAIAPFPHPSHRTQRADFPHCALGQDFTPSSTARRVQAGSDARARRSRRGARVDSCRPCFVWSCA
jgi:hypothetical protein